MATLPRTTAQPLGLTWDDSMSPAYSFPTGGTSPSLTAITTNISGMAYGTDDLGHWAIQLPHDCTPGSDLRLHVHFVFPTQPTAGPFWANASPASMTRRPSIGQPGLGLALGALARLELAATGH